MLQKNIFKIILLCMALAQLSFASICLFPSNYTLRQPSENDKNLPATIQMVKFIVDNGANLYFKLNEGIKGIRDAVIKSLESLPIGSQIVEPLRNATMEIEKKYPPCKALHEFKYMISANTLVYSSYTTKPIHYKDDDIKLVSKALDNQDAFNIVNNITKDVTEFIRKSEQKYENLKESIKKENIDLSEYLNKWSKEKYMTEEQLINKAINILDLPFAEWLVQSDIIKDNKAAINYALA